MATLRTRPGKNNTTRFNVYWRLGGSRDGKTQSLTFDNETDALKAQRIVERAPSHSLRHDQVLAELWHQPILVEGKTVADIVDGYLNALSEADAGTKMDYRSRLNLEVLPDIGHLAVDAVKPSHIRDIMTRLDRCDCDKTTGKRGPLCARRRLGRKDEDVNGHQGGLSKRTRDRYYNVMKGLFSYAVEEGMRSDNPVKLFKYKTQNLSSYHSSRKEDSHFYMTKEQYKLLRSKFPAEYWPLVEFMVMTGTRFSEATAAKVRSVRQERGTWLLDVVDTWKKGDRINGRRQYLPGEPKHGSNRTIDIEAKLVETMAPLRVSRKPTDPIFRDPEDGRLKYDTFYDVWQRAVREATRCPDHMPLPEGQEIGLEHHKPTKCGANGGRNQKGNPCGQWVRPGWDRCPDHCGIPLDAASTCDCTDPEDPKRLPKQPKIHDLRHTHTAWLVEAGVPLIEISQRLGHSSTAVSETIYAGLIKTKKSRERLATALSLD